jgi:hypothetical protein
VFNNLSGIEDGGVMKREVNRTNLVGAAMCQVVLAGLVISFLGCGKATEEIAYVRGIKAYVYGFPLVLMDVTSKTITAVAKAGEYHAPMNQLLRMRTYVSPDYKDVVRISRNSLWSGGVFDLEKEPIVFSHPDTKGRYIVIQLINMWTDDFGSIGSRTTGTGAGNFLIAGPKWNGTPPPDIKDVYRCSTRYGWVLVQIAAKGPEEFKEVNALQDQLKITPLSAWGRPYTPPDNVPVDPTTDTTALPFDQVRLMDGEHFFKRLAMLLKDNPPYPDDAPMLEKLKKIGIEPGKEFDINKLDPALAKGLNRAPQKVWDIFQSAPYEMKTVNGWILPLNLGRYGTDYNTRAFIAYFGLGALTSDDVVYPSAVVDGDGRALYADSKYVMHFEKDQIFPSHSGVWSISQYRENFYVHNPLERYATGSGMPLKYNPDGSLDVYIQATSPGPDKESNWLPTPPSGPFNLTIRVYQPKAEMMNGQVKDNLMVGPATYKIPPVTRVQ